MERLRPADYVAGLGGLLLLCSLFAPWTQLSDGTEDGWRSLALVDILLFLTALMAMLLPVITALKDDPALPVKWDVLTAWAALLAVVLTLVKALGGPEWGGYLALAASLLTFVGCLKAQRDQRAPGLRTPPETRAMPTPPAADPTRPAS